MNTEHTVSLNIWPDSAWREPAAPLCLMQFCMPKLWGLWVIRSRTRARVTLVRQTPVLARLCSLQRRNPFRGFAKLYCKSKRDSVHYIESSLDSITWAALKVITQWSADLCLALFSCDSPSSHIAKSSLLVSHLRQITEQGLTTSKTASLIEVIL